MLQGGEVTELLSMEFLNGNDRVFLIGGKDETFALSPQLFIEASKSFALEHSIVSSFKLTGLLLKV